MSTPEYIRYFDGHAALEHEYLHPGGKHATGRLLSLLAPQLRENSTILEIGCGVGVTASMLLSNFPVRYIGVDASPKMLQRCRKRLMRFDQRASLLNLDVERNSIPIQDESVDVIIAESVFAILNPEIIFRECRRVLKNGGIIGWNDRLWGETISEIERKKINGKSVKLFGFPAAPSCLSTPEEWKKFLIQFDLTVTHQEIVESQSTRSTISLSNNVAKLSGIILHPLRSIGVYSNDRRMEKAFKDVWGKMENWIFLASKQVGK